MCHFCTVFLLSPHHFPKVLIFLRFLVHSSEFVNSLFSYLAKTLTFDFQITTFPNGNSSLFSLQKFFFHFWRFSVPIFCIWLTFILGSAMNALFLLSPHHFPNCNVLFYFFNVLVFFSGRSIFSYMANRDNFDFIFTFSHTTFPNGNLLFLLFQHFCAFSGGFFCSIFSYMANLDNLDTSNILYAWQGNRRYDRLKAQWICYIWPFFWLTRSIAI